MVSLDRLFGTSLHPGRGGCGEGVIGRGKRISWESKGRLLGKPGSRGIRCSLRTLGVCEEFISACFGHFGVVSFIR